MMITFNIVISTWKSTLLT